MMSEPVTLLNSSTMKIYYGKSTKSTQGYFFITDRSPRSQNYSTEYIFTYPQDSCYLNSNTTLDVCSLISKPYLSGYLYLTMGSYSFQDYARVPNPNVVIGKGSMLKEGSPGM
jgi:hypothetical protein